MANDQNQSQIPWSVGSETVFYLLKTHTLEKLQVTASEVEATNNL